MVKCEISPCTNQTLNFCTCCQRAVCLYHNARTVINPLCVECDKKFKELSKNG